MPRCTPWALILGLTVGALFLDAHPSVSFADDEEPTKGADSESEEQAPKTIEWVMGWAAGQAQAKADGKLVFLYFGRYRPG